MLGLSGMFDSSVYLAHPLPTCWHIHLLPLIINDDGQDDLMQKRAGEYSWHEEQRDRVRLAVSSGSAEGRHRRGVSDSRIPAEPPIRPYF